MFDILKEDLQAKARWYAGPQGTPSLLRMLASDGTFTSILYRASRFCYHHHLGWIGAFFSQLNPILTHATIGRGASFGPGLVIVHSVGLVINTNVRGGRNIVMEHDVTIGAEKGATPVLGDNIFIGAGARIIGGVRIGNNVRIGANAVVVKDVPDEATVVGVPARIVRMGDRKVQEAEVDSFPPP
jgi:serine O-acetyltransferase